MRWRRLRVGCPPNNARGSSRVEEVLRDACAELAVSPDEEAIVAGVARAVAGLLPSHAPYQIGLAGHPSMVRDAPSHPRPRRTRLVAVTARPRGLDAPVGALLVDPVTAAQPHLLSALQVLSVQARLALDRIRTNGEIARARADRNITALVEQAADVILIVDEDNRIRYASPSARTVFGTSALHGVRLTDLVDPPERRMAEYLLRQARSGGEDQVPDSGLGTGRADWTIRSRQGSTALAEVSCRDLRAEESVRGVVVTLRDVTAQRHLEHELTTRVFRDPLTGLANRLSFADRVGQAVTTSAGLAGVAFVDLNDFRAVNERLGHAVGDTVLKNVGRRLSEAVGHDGVAARLGGDEFAVLLLDVPTADAVDGFARHVVQSLAEPMPVNGDAPACSASVGVATTVQARSAQELLRHADIALHAAKSAGAGQWRRYEPSMANTFRDRRELLSALGRAVHDGSLLVVYQPIVALTTGHTVGLEALVRWQHPTRGRLPPSEFIDVAEESGLIVPIGEWVLATAVQAAAGWHGATPYNLPYVSVNVSAQQFRSPGFVDAVGRLLAEHQLPPQRLVLEITESLLLRDDDAVWEQLRQMREWGVRIAIDDFGTGYSALGYLRQVPLDVVKLDRVFTATLGSSLRQRELVEGIVALTRTLNLDVVAEGIETERQRAISASIGCAYGQGYLFARPMPQPDVARWLAGESG